MPSFTTDALERACCAVFHATGVSEDAARTVTEHLLEAEISGVISHGLIRIPQYVEAIEAGEVALDAQLTLVNERPSGLVFDGGGGFGPVLAHEAMERTIGKARSNGIAAATLRHTSHTGRLASYALQAARERMIGMVLVNAGGRGQWVAPFGGRSPRLSTNPIAFAVPREDGFPIVLDIATSVVPEGKVRTMHVRGEDVPKGWIVRADGEPTTNPADLYGDGEGPRGAIQSMGGHKGYGLSFIVDLLAGALSGAGTCQSEDAPLSGGNDGTLLVAIDVGSFSSMDHFGGLANALVDYVHSCPPCPGFDEVLAPGELEARSRERALESGVEIEEARWATISAPFERLGVSIETN